MVKSLGLEFCGLWGAWQCACLHGEVYTWVHSNMLAYAAYQVPDCTSESFFATAPYIGGTGVYFALLATKRRAEER